MVKRVNGKKLADNLLNEISKKKTNARLAIIWVGNDRSSEVYISMKKKAIERVGMTWELFHFEESISEDDLETRVKEISFCKEFSGVMVQLPLPSRIDGQRILDLIPLEKDVDQLSSSATTNLLLGKTEILPPIVSAIVKIFESEKINLFKKDIVIIGAGRLVGKPLALWFLSKNIGVSVVNEFTPDISFYAKKADIIISAVGKPGILNAKMVKSGCVVIDAGFSTKKGKSEGDVDFKTVSKKAAIITPVPGGVGPLNVACIVENLSKLEKQKSS